MIEVTVNGTTLEFPDSTTQEQIKQVIAGREATTPMQDGMIQPEQDDGTEDDAFDFPMLSPLNKKQQSFRDKIANIETGGLENPYIRTKARPSGKQSGSSAYGTFQITKGLLKQHLKNGKAFEESELDAMRTLEERQQVAVLIGGRDRPKFELGGSQYAQSRMLMKKYGFEDVTTFLDAFDYGGDFGLSEDDEFQMQYEQFGRKMLNSALRKAGGDELEAASVWHGGAGWKKAKSIKDTNKYRDKYIVQQEI